MKYYYQTPETELVTIGCTKVILQDDEPDMSGEIVDPEANKNDIFEDGDIIYDGVGSSNLWDK